MEQLVSMKAQMPDCVVDLATKFETAILEAEATEGTTMMALLYLATLIIGSLPYETSQVIMDMKLYEVLQISCEAMDIPVSLMPVSSPVDGVQ